MPLALETMGKTKKLDDYFQQPADSSLYWSADSQSEPVSCIFTLSGGQKSHSDPDLVNAAPKYKTYSQLLPSLERLVSQDDKSSQQFRHSFDCLHVDNRISSNNSPESSPVQLRKVSSCATTALEKARRRVTFADEAGKQLTHVKIIKEPNHLPPKLNFGVLRPPHSVDASSSDGSPDSHCRFKCQFAQPSSKYVMFREALAKNCVSLSNVYFDSCTAKGSIVVKNLSFNKRVFVRVTLDDWRSFVDHDAVFTSSYDGQHDNFSFSFECPSQQEGQIQFCVCFECDCGQYWDSNGGVNYRILPQRRKSRDPFTRDCKPNFACVPDFAEFSSWKHFGDSVYY